MTEPDDDVAGREAASAADQNADANANQGAEQEAQTADANASTEGADGERMVPVAALQKEREKAKRYTDQVAQFEQKLEQQNRAWESRFEQLIATLKPQQQPQQTPDFFEDPRAAVQHEVSQFAAPLQQAIMQQRETMSRMMATEKHGEQAVSAAYQGLSEKLRSDPGKYQDVYRQIMSSPHPYGALVEWHGREQLMSEIGSDPASYREKLKAELLAELQNEGQKTQQAQKPAMPSNFATGRNVGSRSGPAWSGPPSFEDIFDRR